MGIEGGAYVIAPYSRSNWGFERDRSRKEIIPGDTPLEEVVRHLVDRAVSALPKS